MTYDEDLLVELIACGDVSQTEIAERVGVSRRTVWRIANGHSRPDLQQKIADTVEGFRQATIRMAAKWMKPLLSKQIKVALEEDGETSRKCREFLLKTFMITLPEQAAKAAAKKRDPDPSTGLRADRQLDDIALYNSLTELSPDLKDQVVEELGGPTDERLSTTDTTDSTDDTDVEKATATDDPVSGDKGKKVKKPFDPFANFVDGPHGKKINVASIRAIEEAKEEAKTIPTRRRVKPNPNPYHHP